MFFFSAEGSERGAHSAQAFAIHRAAPWQIRCKLPKGRVNCGGEHENSVVSL